MKNVPEAFSLMKNLEQNYLTDNLDSSILNNINAFVFIFDYKELKPVWLNKYFYDSLKYSRKDFENLTTEQFLSLFHPASLTEFMNTMEHYMDQTSGNLPSVYQIRNKENAWVYMTVSSRIFETFPDGSIKSLIGFGTKIEKDELKDQIKKINRLNSDNEVKAKLDKLSDHEIQIVSYITFGFTDKEIAEKLNISINTTKTHRKRILSKLNLKNTAALVKFAVENGIC